VWKTFHPLIERFFDSQQKGVQVEDAIPPLVYRRGPAKKMIEKKNVRFVGVDDGYAAIKLSWFSDNGKIVSKKIPSQVREGEYGISDLDGAPSGYQTDGISYTIGDFRDGERTRFSNFAVSPIVRVLVHHALIDAGFEGETVSIGTGLPPRDYFLTDGRQKNESLIATKIQQMAKPVTRIGGGAVTTISNHIVLSQAIGAVVDEIYDIASDAIIPLSGPVGVIDIGGRTTDVAVIFQSKGICIDHKRSGSEDIGVLDVLDDIELSIRKKFNVSSLSLGSLQKALETGVIRNYGKNEDVSEFVEAAKTKVAERIKRFVSSKFGDGSDLEKILLVGGGSHPFRKIFGFPRQLPHG